LFKTVAHFKRDINPGAIRFFFTKKQWEKEENSLQIDLANNFCNCEAPFGGTRTKPGHFLHSHGPVEAQGIAMKRTHQIHKLRTTTPNQNEPMLKQII